MWMGDVIKDGVSMPRFKKIDDEQVIEELEKIKDEMYGVSLG